MSNHKTRLQKIEKKTQPGKLTWRELIEIARLDESDVEQYKQVNPEKYKNFTDTLETARTWKPPEELSKMLEALQ